MDYFDNDYLIPVILSNGKTASFKARTIRNITKIRPFIFSNHFSLFQRLAFKCIKLPRSKALMVEHLCHFASKMSSQGSLLLIYGEEYSQFVEENAQELESRYIAVSFDEAINSYKEDSCQYEN